MIGDVAELLFMTWPKPRLLWHKPVPQMCVCLTSLSSYVYRMSTTTTSSEGSGSETETRQTMKGLSEALPEGGHWRPAANWSNVTVARASESTFSCPCVLMHDVLSQRGVCVTSDMRVCFSLSTQFLCCSYSLRSIHCSLCIAQCACIDCICLTQARPTMPCIPLV